MLSPAEKDQSHRTGKKVRSLTRLIEADADLLSAQLQELRSRAFPPTAVKELRKFTSGEAYVKGKYTIPEGKLDATKTAATKKLWDGNKVAETNAVHDGSRQFLGREQAKLGNAIDPKSLADWRTGETVIYNGSGADRASTFKQLTIGDIRDLLNKNK